MEEYMEKNKLDCKCSSVFQVKDYSRGNECKCIKSNKKEIMIDEITISKKKAS